MGGNPRNGAVTRTLDRISDVGSLRRDSLMLSCGKYSGFKGDTINNRTGEGLLIVRAYDY